MPAARTLNNFLNGRSLMTNVINTYASSSAGSRELNCWRQLIFWQPFITQLEKCGHGFSLLCLLMVYCRRSNCLINHSIHVAVLSNVRFVYVVLINKRSSVISQYRSSQICPTTTVLFKSLYFLTSYRKKDEPRCSSNIHSSNYEINTPKLSARTQKHSRK